MGWHKQEPEKHQLQGLRALMLPGGLQEGVLGLPQEPDWGLPGVPPYGVSRVREENQALPGARFSTVERWLQWEGGPGGKLVQS